jgi:dihydrofolate synthase/folylpolyglutamate synthase
VSLAKALEALYARVPLGMRLGLEPMRAACKDAGSPEASFQAVHVGGTNGKGSTSAMVEAIARASGLRTGLYTSPHLCRFAERIRIDGEPITDEALTGVLERALAIGKDLSFFETATLAAFLAFQDAKVDLAVIEVGIGGRLDATNVLPAPRCTAITKIAFDHMDRLGDTLGAIAREKAGIAKKDVPLVLGPMHGEPLEAIQEVAATVGAPIVRTWHALENELIGLQGSYQKENAAVAWTIANVLGWDVETRRRGLESARWPGRFERIVMPDGPYLLDGAHNPDGALELVRALRVDKAVRDDRLGAYVFGALADKAWPEVLETLSMHPLPFFYVRPKGRTAADPTALAARHPGTICDDLDDALDRARAAVERRTVVVTGSLYLVGEARAKLLGLPLDPPVAL